MKKHTDTDRLLTTTFCSLDDLKKQNEQLINELSEVKAERDRAIKLLRQAEYSITYVALKVKIKEFFDMIYS